MPRYTKAVNLWSEGVQEAIHNGNLKLQCGQWVYCGNREHKSRFVMYSGHTFWVAHWEGEKHKTKESFKRYVRTLREWKERTNKQNKRSN